MRMRFYLTQRAFFPVKYLIPQKPWQMGLIKLACPIDHPLMKKEYLGPKGNPKDYMLDSIAVLPVRFRQERLGIARDFQNDLNILYRNVLQINSQLKTVLDDENSTDELQEFLKKRLFNAVKKLFSVDRKYRNRRRGIIDILKGKEALVRGHMLGKRVDYSGRAVIIGDPSLSLDEARIPDELWDKILPDVPKDEKPLVLLNRQPSLHRYSIQAFRVSTHRRGDVICINPFVCKPFNADFDGDTIAIHVPRTDLAKNEAEKLLPSRNLLSNANGKMVLGFDKDFALAAAYITFNKDSVSDHDEVPFTSECDVPLEGKDYWEEVTVQGIKTTAGRLRLKRLFGDIPILNRCMDKRDWFQNLERLTHKASKEDPEILIRFAHDISILFQDALKRSGFSLSLSDFSDETSNGYAPSLLWFLRKSGKYSEDVEKQIVLKRGRMRRPGRDDEFTEPIESCLLNGHSESEYLCSAHGARAGLVDKGLITSYSGYFLRDLIYKLQHLYIIEEDCRASNGLIADNIDHDQILGNRFVVDDSLANEITKETPFRSPLTCTAKDSLNHAGICQKCYGLDPATGKLPEIGLPVGILAAQAIGERVSQETLKSFHTGGKVETEKKGLALVRYLRKAFSEASKNASVQKLIEIYNQFPESNRPHLVHFEVVLAGYMSSKNGDNFLSKLAHSQAPDGFLRPPLKEPEMILMM